MLKKLLAITVVGWMLTGCSPEVGSEAWCEDMEETPKGEWTSNDAGNYAKHCVFR